MTTTEKAQALREILHFMDTTFSLRSDIDYTVRWGPAAEVFVLLKTTKEIGFGRVTDFERAFQRAYRTSITFENSPYAYVPPSPAEHEEDKRCPGCGADKGHVHSPDCPTKRELYQSEARAEFIPADVTPSPTEHPLDPNSAMLVIKRDMLTRFGATLNTDYWMQADHLFKRILIWVTPAMKAKWPSLETAILTDFQKFSIARMELYLRSGDHTSIPFHGPTAGSNIPATAADQANDKNWVEAIDSMMKRHFNALRGCDYWVLVRGYAFKILLAAPFAHEHPAFEVILKKPLEKLRSDFGYQFSVEAEKPIPSAAVPLISPPKHRYKIKPVADKTLAEGYVRLRFIRVDPEPGRVLGPIMETGVMTAQDAREFVNDLVMTSPAFAFYGTI